MNNEIGACPMCRNQYTPEGERIPRFFNCSQLHLICSECIEKALISGEEVIECPFDHEKIHIRGKNINDFKPNRAVIEFLEEKRKKNRNPCPIHPQSNLDIFCVSCKTQICYQCTKAKHRFHQTRTLQRVNEEAEKGFPDLKDKIQQIKEIESLYGKVLDRARQKLEEQVDTKLNQIFTELTKKAELMKQQIYQVFEEERHRKRNKGIVAESIMNWRKETEKCLGDLNKLNQGQNARQQLFADLWQLGEIFGQLEMLEWQDEQKGEAKSLEQALKDISVNFNPMLLEIIENLSLGEFKPNNSERIEDNEKIICGSYIIKKKNNDRLKKVKSLFENIRDQDLMIKKEEDLGVLEVTDYVFDDDLAKRISSLVEAQPGKMKTVIRENIHDIRLRCINLTENGLKSLGSFLNHLSLLKKVIIDFNEWEHIPLEKLRHFLMALPCSSDLEELKLALQKPNMTSQEFNDIMETFCGFPNLQSIALDFSKCKNISNKAIWKGLKVFSFLENLNTIFMIFTGFLRCKKVNDEYLEDIGKRLAKVTSLRSVTFDFTECPNFNNPGNHLHLGLGSRLSEINLEILK